VTPKNTQNIVIIGGGFGGLSAAVRLQANGYNVTVLEKRNQLGGRAGLIERKGFRFDTGPTIITPPSVVEDIFLEAGRDPQDYVELVSIHPHYRLHYADGTHFDIGTFEEVAQQIQQLSPNDLKGYQKWLEINSTIKS